MSMNTLRLARRDDFITKLVAVDYRPDAVCPEFERLLNRLFDHVPAVRQYLEGLSDRRLKQIGEAMRPVEVLDADELVVEA